MMLTKHKAPLKFPHAMWGVLSFENRQHSGPAAMPTFPPGNEEESNRSLAPKVDVPSIDNHPHDPTEQSPMCTSSSRFPHIRGHIQHNAVARYYSELMIWWFLPGYSPWLGKLEAPPILPVWRCRCSRPHKFLLFGPLFLISGLGLVTW